jgi:hypothetical protein
MSRAERRRRSWQYARRSQRLHLRQTHPDGALDGVCERSVWFFEKQKVSRHTKHCGMCSLKYRETGCRPRVKRDMVECRAAADLALRVAYVEGRLLPFDEARRQRERG